MYLLKDLQIKNSDNGENNHRVIVMYINFKFFFIMFLKILVEKMEKNV
jgi:hypothetical protein